MINNTRVLLDAWLVEVPDHAVNFANLILLYTFIDCFTTPLYTAVLATKKIKVYEIVLTILYFVNITCTYLAFNVGLSPESGFVLAIIFKIAVLFLLAQQCCKLFDFDKRSYLRMFVTTIVPTLLYGSIISIVYQYFVHNDSFLKLIGFTIVFEALMLPFIWYYGFNRNEREFVTKSLKEKFNISRS
jgi:hypothetical protein